MLDNEPPTVPASLLPCPFCGGEADYERLHTAKWSVGCLEDYGFCFGYQTLTLFDTKKAARAAWNTRIASTPASEDAGRLREALWAIEQLTQPWGGAPTYVETLLRIGERARAALPLAPEQQP